MRSFPRRSPAGSHRIERPNVEVAGCPQQLFFRRARMEWQCPDLHYHTRERRKRLAVMIPSDSTSGVLTSITGPGGP